MNDVSVIQLFLLDCQITGRFVKSMLLKRIGFLALPITIRFSFSADALQNNYFATLACKFLLSGKALRISQFRHS